MGFITPSVPFAERRIIQMGDKIYFLIGDKKIPILRMWHTSFYQGKIEPLQGYSNKIIGKLCAKCREEMKRYNLI